MTPPAGGGGLFDSLRRLLGSGIETVQVRLALFGSELEGEKLRVFDGLLQAALALLMFTVATVLTVGFVILLFWDGYRLPAIGVLVFVFAGLGLWLTRRARAMLQAPEGG
ncbi:MAG: phage holin family protein, partial [Rubrivivax sp.]|nr:phage holin family protein [Rubrivivax sp.]